LPSCFFTINIRIMYGKRSRYRKTGVYMYSGDEIKIIAVTFILILSVSMML